MVAMFFVVLAAILGEIQGGEVASVSDDLYKIEETVRRTTNKLFSNLRLRGIRQQPNIQTFALVHNYFIALTLQNYNSLDEVFRLTRANKTYKGNDTIFITTFNDIVDEENGLFIAEKHLDVNFEIKAEMYKLAYLRKYSPDPDKFKDITAGILKVLGKNVKADNKNVKDTAPSKVIKTNFVDKREHETQNMTKHEVENQKPDITLSDYTDSFEINSDTGEIKIYITNFTQKVTTNHTLPININKSAITITNSSNNTVTNTTVITLANSTSLGFVELKEKNDSKNITSIEEMKTVELVAPTKNNVSVTGNLEINSTSTKNITILKYNDTSITNSSTVVEVPNTTVMTLSNSTSLGFPQPNLSLAKENNDSSNITFTEVMKTTKEPGASVEPTENNVSVTENLEINPTSTKNITIIKYNDTFITNRSIIEVPNTTVISLSNSTSLGFQELNLGIAKEKNYSTYNTSIEITKTTKETGAFVEPTEKNVSMTEKLEINATSTKNTIIITYNVTSSLSGKDYKKELRTDTEIKNNNTSPETGKTLAKIEFKSNGTDKGVNETIQKYLNMFRRSNSNSKHKRRMGHNHRFKKGRTMGQNHRFKKERRMISAENDKFFEYSASIEDDDVRDVANAIEVAPGLASAIQALINPNNKTAHKIKSYVSMEKHENVSVKLEKIEKSKNILSFKNIKKSKNEIELDDLGEDSVSDTSKREDLERKKRHKKLAKKRHRHHKHKAKKSDDLNYESESHPVISNEDDTESDKEEKTNAVNEDTAADDIDFEEFKSSPSPSRNGDINAEKDEIEVKSTTKDTVLEKVSREASAQCNSSESSVENNAELRNGLSIPLDNNITESLTTLETDKATLSSLSTYFNTVNDEITVTTSKTTEEASDSNKASKKHKSRRRSRRRNRKPSEYWSPEHDEDTRRIFKGKSTKVKNFPFMASIQIFGQFQCGGCIIESDLVITAASCLQLAWNNRYYRENPNFLAVRVGTKYSTASGDVIAVFEIHFHPSYIPKTLKNNLAIIRLQRHINFEAKNVKMIMIDRKDHELPLVTDAITVLGWGSYKLDSLAGVNNVYTSVLKVAVLDIYPFWDCREIYSKEYVTRDNFCAGFVSMGGGACNRDVGGPGVVENLLTGVISFGAPSCGTPDAPTVFTKLGYYADWIDDIMEADSPLQKVSTTKKMKKYFATLSRENELPWGVTPLITGSDMHVKPVDKDEGSIVRSTKGHVEEKKFFYEFLRTVFNSKEMNEYLDVMKDPTAKKAIGRERPVLKKPSKHHMRPVPYKIHHTTAYIPPSHITTRTPYAVPSPQNTRNPRFFAGSSEGNSDSECEHDVEEFMATMALPPTQASESDYDDPTTEKQTRNTQSEVEFPSYFEVLEDAVTEATEAEVTEATTPGFRFVSFTHEDNTTDDEKDSDVDLQKRIQKLVGSAEVLVESTGPKPEFPELLSAPTEKKDVREALHKTLFHLYLSDNENKKPEISNEEILLDSDVKDKDDNAAADYADAESVVGLLNKGPLSQDIILDIIKEVIDEAYLKKQPTPVARVSHHHMHRRQSTADPAPEVFRSVDMKKKK